MDGEDRKVPGERLTRRLHERVARRPRLGFAPEFYARHGLDDPWAMPGEPEPEPAAESGMVYLSGAPYRAMMRRLAAARKRRERRTAAFAERRSGTKLRAVSRRWPGEPGVATVSIARLAASDVVLPAPAASKAEEPTEITEEGVPVRRSDKARAREISGASAWGTAGSSSRPAPPTVLPAAPRAATAAPAAAPAARQLDRVGHRLAPARDAYVDMLATAVAPSRRRKVARAVEEVELLPEPERRPALARRMKALGAAGPVLREVEPSLAASPRRVRAVTPTSRVTAVSFRSPALALASSAETDRAASSTLAAAVHQPRPQAPWSPRPSAFGVPAWAAGLATSARSPRPAAPAALPPEPRVSARPAAASPSAPPSASPARPAPAALLPEALPEATTTRPAPRRPVGSWAPVGDEGEAPAPWRAPLSARAVARSFGDEVIVGPRAFQPRAVSALRTAHTLATSDLAIPEVAPPAVEEAPAEGPATMAPRRASSARAGSPAWAAAPEGASTSPVARPQVRVPATAPLQEGAAALPEGSATALPRASGIATASARGVVLPPSRLSASPVSRVSALWQEPATEARPTARRGTRATTAETVATAPAARSPGPTFRRPVGLPDTADLPYATREAAPEPATSFGDEPQVGARPVAARPGGPAAWPPSRPGEAARPLDAARPGEAPRSAAGVRPVDAARAAAPARPGAPGGTPDVADTGVPGARPAATLQASARADRAWGVPAPQTNRAERAFAELRRALGLPATTELLPSTSYAHAFARVGADRAAAPAVRFVASAVKDAVLATREAPAGESPSATLAAALGEATVTGASPLHRLSERAAAPPAAPAARVSGPLAWTGGLRPRAEAPAPEGGSPSSRPAELRRRSARADTRATPARARTLATADLTPVTAAALPTPEVPAVGEEAPRARSLSWANARADVTRATAYQGALGDPAPAEPARATRTSRRAASPELTPVDGPAPDLGRRLHGLAANASPEAGSPTWSARADGTPRVRSVNGLFDALARARDTEEVVRVLFLRADGLREAPAEVRAPIQAVVQEIREQVAASDPRPVSVPTETVRPPRTAAPETRTLQQAPVRASSQRSASGATRPSAVAWRGATTIHSGDDRVMKLVRKLQDLIHLAEAQNRLSDAQRQVRMAEDSAQARAEAGHGGAKPGAPVGGNEQVDIDALVREVSAAISNELQLRRSRRMEDPDESVWW